MNRHCVISSCRRAGFNLTELILVMAIGSMLMAMVVPLAVSISQGSSLSRAGQEFSSTLILARQEALARNRKVEFRLIQLPDNAGGALRYRAVQAWMKKDDADTDATIPLSKPMVFPTGVVIAESPDLSPLLQTPPGKIKSTTVSGAACHSVAFSISADGGLDGTTVSSTSSFVTLVQEKDVTKTAAPSNFVSIFINPITGEVSTFQP